MRRPVLSVLLLGLACLVLPPSSASQSPAAQEPKERRNAKAGQDKDKDKDKKEKRVYTNDDLEAARQQPSAVQDATARDAKPYEPTQPASRPDEPPQPPTPASPELSPQEMRIKELEETIKSLDASAKSLLWQYLQSSDTNEIMRLKAEQQSVLEELEQAKAELAQLKGEETGRPAAPAATPTPQPG